MFTVQVITSSLLLRDALRPQLVWLGSVSAGAIGLSLLLTMLADHAGSAAAETD